MCFAKHLDIRDFSRGLNNKMEEKKDTIQINGKNIAVVIILLLFLVSTFGMLIFNGKKTTSLPDSTNTQTNNKYNNLPEKCRLPAGTDINSWKEHLGHHEDTKDCLKYFK